jgi:hypothetical protein
VFSRMRRTIEAESSESSFEPSSEVSRSDRSDESAYERRDWSSDAVTALNERKRKIRVRQTYLILHHCLCRLSDDFLRTRPAS